MDINFVTDLVEKNKELVKHTAIKDCHHKNLHSFIINEKPKIRLFIADDCIIDAGGGVVLREENIDNLKKNGILFHLFAPAEELFERIKDDSERPLINTENPVKTLKTIQDNREIFYGQADFKINTGKTSPDEAADEIINFFVL